MKDPDVVEYYDKKGLVARVVSTVVPFVGSLVGFKARMWRVSEVSYEMIPGADWEEVSRMRVVVTLGDIEDPK